MPTSFAPLWENQYVRAALQMSGWSPERRVDASAAIDRLVDEGFTANRHAAEILQSFHRIRIDREEPVVPDAKFGRARVAFRPEGDAVDFVELVSGIERDLGTTLFPIADTDDGLGLLLVADDGQVYNSGQGQLFREGIDFNEALIRMITRFDFPDFLGGSLPPWWITKGLAKPKPIEGKR